MPVVLRVLDLKVVWYRVTKLDRLADDVRAAIKIVVAHPLSQILCVGFERLKDLLHDSTLMQQIGEPRYVEWVKHVYLQEVAVSNMIAKKWNSFDQRDVRHESGMIAIVEIPSIADGQGMIDGSS